MRIPGAQKRGTWGTRSLWRNRLAGTWGTRSLWRNRLAGTWDTRSLWRNRLTGIWGTRSFWSNPLLAYPPVFQRPKFGVVGSMRIPGAQKRGTWGTRSLWKNRLAGTWGARRRLAKLQASLAKRSEAEFMQ